MSNYRVWIPALLLCCLSAGLVWGEDRAAPLLGSQIPPFTLASADGKLIAYDSEFYGRHPLVLTFFPAAFTPV